MAIDLEKIREKLDKLSGNSKKKNFSNIPVWKPTAVGEFRIRALPWPSDLTSEGTPFIERYFYYIPKQVLSTYQFGEEDPVKELIDMLFRSKKPEEKEIAKKLLPKMAAYLPIIVKEEQEKGVQLWKLNKAEYQRVLSFFVDEEIGDILDIENGYDLIIKVTDGGRKWEGNSMLDKQIDPSRKQTQLKTWFAGDVAKMQETLANLPSVDEMLKYSRKTPSELKMILDKWLAGDSADETSTVESTTETTRGKDEDDVLAEISKKKSTKTKKTVEVDLDEDNPKTESNIKDAFKDLLED